MDAAPTPPPLPSSTDAGPTDAVLAAARLLAGADPAGAPAGSARLAAVDAFGRALLRRVPRAELALVDPEGVAPALVGAFDTLAARGTSLAEVRVSPIGQSLFGPEGGRTAVDVAIADRPLLFSTVTTALSRLGLRVVRFAHPILDVRRDAEGTLLQLIDTATSEAVHPEVLVHLELAEELGADRREVVAAEVDSVLADLLAAEADLAAMRSRLTEASARLARRGPPHYHRDRCEEAAAYCQWMLDGNFLLTGVRHHDGADSLGVCASRRMRLAPFDPASVLAERPLVVRRSTSTSRVHRDEKLAEVILADLDDDGTLRGAMQFLGLTTIGGRSERPSRTPYVRAALAEILRREGVIPGSHDDTMLRVLYDSLPWDLLMVADIDWLQDAVRGLAAALVDGRPLVRTFAEPEAEAVTLMVALPPAEVRQGIAEEIEVIVRDRLQPVHVETAAALRDAAMTVLSVEASLRPGQLAEVDLDVLAARVTDACRSWSDRLGLRLGERVGPEGRSVARRWLARLTPQFREGTPPSVAADDVLELDEVDSTGEVRLRFLPDTTADARAATSHGGLVRLRAAVGGPAPELSAFVPVLESVGLRVIEEMTFRLPPDGEGTGEATVLDLVVGRRDQHRLSIGDHSEDHALRQAILACWSGLNRVDALNELVLTAGLSWKQVRALRAYCRYLAQIQPGTQAEAAYESLAANPPAARALWQHVETRFAPDHTADPATAGADTEGRARVVEACEDVARLDHERLLRSLLGLVDATTRTNLWSPAGERAVAITFDGGNLPGMAVQQTWREVWVSAPTVEGIHLRAGPVARGGIRWSDRVGDVRTEVLQLMKAQVLKNALIVPTGAKGGFVLTHHPSDPGALRVAVRDAYAIFVGALLSLSDNLVDGVAVHPRGVRPADGADTYLVVAADRGTSAFSDLANAIALERHFWLGDAFASGGSHGYDHKALGVTARGAWVSVTEHFETLGLDVGGEDITVAGVGDMSGDVFGNGMLRSPHIRLVAAFDHRHVFVDPQPDPATSFAERARLFALPSSSWDDYDRSALGPGGLVVSRSDKRVRLGPEARAALGLDDGGEEAEVELTMPELLSAVLEAPVDLLYFGGIGTFVRATGEAHAAAGDPANDEIRVEAARLRCRVVGEGANLALTPRARVEFAAGGGSVNSDAVDNSAGVDCSDHEVNLKILLDRAGTDGRPDRDERNRLLHEAADDVVARVLDNVARQNRALTRAVPDSRRRLESYLAVLFDLESHGRVDRSDNGLPSGSDIRRRRGTGEGLYRPELAVLSAAMKRELADRALETPLPDRAELRMLLEGYFPEDVRDRAGELLHGHPLAGRIVATVLANEVVDRMGVPWVLDVMRRSGTDPAAVLAAYWLARCTVQISPWWSAIDHAPLAERDALWDPAADVIDALTDDYLRRNVADEWAWDEVERNAAAAAVLAQWHEGGLTADNAMTPGREPTERADRLRLLSLSAALADVAASAGCSPKEAVEPFITAGELAGIDQLSWALLGVELDPSDAWALRHRQRLLSDLDQLRRRVAATLVAEQGGDGLAAELAAVRPDIEAAVSAADGTLDPMAVAVADLWQAVARAGII